MSIRKKPRLADPETPDQLPEQDVQVEPPPPEGYPTVVQRTDPIDLPNSPEQVIHNVMVRQLEDDAKLPPEEDKDIPALQLLADLQKRKDTGQSVAPLQQLIGRVTQGVDIETKITLLSFITLQNRTLLGWMKSGEALNKLLWRMMGRGDLKPHEAIVLKKMQVAEQQQIVQVLAQLSEKVDLRLPDNAATDLDFVVQVVDKRQLHPDLDKMTPAGREIFRKIMVRARRHKFGKKNEEKEKPNGAGS